MLKGFNFVKNKNKKLNIIKTGAVIHFEYILIKEDEIRIAPFIGLCMARAEKNNTILLKNYIKRTEMYLLIYGHAPLIFSAKIIKKYRKKYRLNKLYYDKRK
jgi:ribosomal protein L19